MTKQNQPIRRPGRRRSILHYITMGIGISILMIVPALYTYNKVVMAGYRLIQYPFALNGDAEAQYEMGETYRVFAGSIRPDLKAAFRWQMLAAEQGYAPAMFMIGQSYHLGHGVGFDIYAAIEWYTKAAEQGNRDAVKWLVLANNRIRKAEEHARNGDYDRANRLTGRR